jgi:GGDEF domain-containing protein
VVIDSRRPQRIGAPLGVPDDHRFSPIIAAGTPEGSSSIGDRPVAYKRLQRLPGNANDWYVIAAARTAVGPLYGVSGWSVALVAVALILLGVAAVSFLTHHRLLVATWMTDALTGISNRPQLKLDLERGLQQASRERPLLLMLFDLNGFKGYNDTFGHPAGDEFCILAPLQGNSTGAIVAAASQALSDHGGGFSITASYGAVLLPQESQNLAEAMRLVDQRMYAQKASARRSPDRQSRDVLLRALQERIPALAPAAKLVRSTHERFDGTGYRDGLAGDQIPLGARIIAVCDAFTAMTSPRPTPTSSPSGRPWPSCASAPAPSSTLPSSTSSPSWSSSSSGQPSRRAPPQGTWTACATTPEPPAGPRTIAM